MVKGRTVILSGVFVAALACAGILIRRTAADLQPLPASLQMRRSGADKLQLVDRRGAALSYTRATRWNLAAQTPLHEIPELLREAFVRAEDKRFFEHRGVDWRARLGAVWQSAASGRIVRGASTITEQAVRMLHPRPRTLWSRWLEGVEARRLEGAFSKTDILEFYLNQVPFGRGLRGVRQAAYYYFDRDLDTLNQREMLSLAVLVRAPSRFDPLHGAPGLAKRVEQLAQLLADAGALSPDDRAGVREHALELRAGTPAVRAEHFVRHVRQDAPDSPESGSGRLRTTLDGSLQRRLQRLLDERVRSLAARDVENGALLAIDHQSDQVLAWVNAGEFEGATPSQIDAVTAPRQPGSTLKPFVYALAMERGWTSATVIEDAPLADAVSAGLHVYRNYSRVYYGPVRLRLALGNSLNTPAVRAARFVTPAALLLRLRELGFESLRERAEYYGDGLALGDGEVTLYEIVRAYAVLARGGIFRDLRVTFDEQTGAAAPRRVFDRETSSLITDILADADARRLEFGPSGLLFPAETAWKTGTSSDFHDAWAIGFSRRFTVGVWMGNLSRKPMREVSGSLGPAVVLQSAFAELERSAPQKPLVRSPGLLKRSICSISGELAGPDCPPAGERFHPQNLPHARCSGAHGLPRGHAAGAQTGLAEEPFLLQPTPGLRLARDPRIPDEYEAYAFEVVEMPGLREVRWIVDGEEVGITRGRRYFWPLRPGEHFVEAAVWTGAEEGAFVTPAVTFSVR